MHDRGLPWQPSRGAAPATCLLDVDVVYVLNIHEHVLCGPKILANFWNKLQSCAEL